MITSARSRHRSRFVAPARRSRSALGDLADPLIWWPSDIKALVAQADGEISGLARDVTAETAAHGNLTIDRPTELAWKAFYKEWVTFRDGLGWFGNMTGATVDRVRDFRQRNAAWRDKIASTGGKVTGPAPSNLDPEDPIDKLLGAAKYVGIGLGAFALFRIASDAGLFRAIGGKRP